MALLTRNEAEFASMSTSPLGFDALVVQNVEGDSFLDVGCGHGKWGYLLKKYRWTKEASVNGRRSQIKVTGIDLFEPHVRSLKEEGIYDSVHVARATKLPFENKSFDSAIACEVLEHLPQAEGPQLIAELTRVSRRSFVVTTPNFPCLRPGGETLDGFNEYEAHRHNFLYSEFCNLGFTQVVGVGLKTPSWKLSRALGSLGLYLPRFSRYLIGYWFADGKKRILEI
jgi:ubiquinone/menaquinone biosynthesis C-methylase UbiE